MQGWRKNLTSHLRGCLGLGVVVTTNANRSNARATIRDRMFTGIIEQVQMANIQAFQGLQLMKCMRQYVFAHDGKRRPSRLRRYHTRSRTRRRTKPSCQSRPAREANRLRRIQALSHLHWSSHGKWSIQDEPSSSELDGILGCSAA